MKPLCIYHGNCADGFAAAWVVRKFFGANGVDFHAGVYQNPPPDVTGRDVIMVDFSFKRPVLEEMAKVAKSLLILDHHKTAAEDLGGMPAPIEAKEWTAFFNLDNAAGKCEVGAIFDMERSGAMITWDFFYPGQACPDLLRHIQDRDLWLFKLEGTREIQANLFSYPYDFEVWDTLINSPPGKMIPEGRAIERKHHKDVGELVGVMKRRMKIAGYDVFVANLPYTLTSDAGHLMAKNEPFAACYWDTPDGRVFSLRSADGGLDVSEIAKRYGGGGHPQAAGFRMPIGWEGDDAAPQSPKEPIQHHSV